jgi:hypothetical protein
MSRSWCDTCGGDGEGIEEESRLVEIRLRGTTTARVPRSAAMQSGLAQRGLTFGASGGLPVGVAGG